MNIQEYIDLLLFNLQPWAKLVSGNREILTRCKYCEDSKNYNNGHLYIGIPEDEKSLSFFHCKKCEASGVVTSKVLTEWGIYNSDLLVNISSHNKVAAKYGTNRNALENRIYNVKNYFIRDHKISDKKLEYINGRLGLCLDYDDILENKIVLNLFDLLKSNYINSYTRDIRIMNELDSYFLGFLSYDNGFVNLRNLSMKNTSKYLQKRYVNYNIFNSINNRRKYYVNPNKIDLSGTSPIEVHVAEGVFDILSIKFNLRKENDRIIYVGACGSGYKGICRDMMLTVAHPNLIFHIYPDADISDYKMRELYYYLKEFNYDMIIHRNVFPKQKDFGVDINHIDEKIIRAKEIF